MWDDLAEKSLQKIPSSHAQMGVIKCVMRYSILAVCNMHTPSENEGPLNSISLLCHPMKKIKTQLTPAKKKVSGGGPSIYFSYFSEMSDVFGQERTYIAFLEPYSFFLDSAVCKQFRATISAKAKFFPENAGCNFGNILDISPLSELARRQN